MMEGPASPAGRREAQYFIRLALSDIQASSRLPEALDDTMPGVLERKSLLTMTRLWDKTSWTQHRSINRWWLFIRNWPQSSILQAIKLPIYTLLLITVVIMAFNRAVAILFGIDRVLQLPLAPLSLQAASIGLLVVFRNNQTHDRLKEAQRSLGGLGPLGREVTPHGSNQRLVDCTSTH